VHGWSTSPRLDASSKKPECADYCEASRFSEPPAFSFVHQQKVRPGFDRKSDRLSLAPIQQGGQFCVGFARKFD